MISGQAWGADFVAIYGVWVILMLSGQAWEADFVAIYGERVTVQKARVSQSRPVRGVVPTASSYQNVDIQYASQVNYRSLHACLSTVLKACLFKSLVYATSIHDHSPSYGRHCCSSTGLHFRVHGSLTPGCIENHF